jgi:hypothetical protein
MLLDVEQEVDATGELEEYSWDLFPIMDSNETLHLQASGLPKLGTWTAPGMIIVGKIGKTRFFDPAHQPTALEIHGLDREELATKYGRMWNNKSLYADDKIFGLVEEAYFLSKNGRQVAIVRLNKQRG